MRELGFQNLIKKYQNNYATDKEKEIVEEWLDNLENSDNDSSWNDNEISNLKNKVMLSIADEKPVVRKLSSVKRWITSIAAAFLLIIGSYYIYQSNNKDHITQINPEQILPVEESITLTLENGEVVKLKDGNLIQKDGEIQTENDKNILLSAFDGRIPNQKITLSTPKGKQLTITLEDGTKVWLNANTVLTYPLFFDGSERIVDVWGEAYFEVSHAYIDNNEPKKILKPFLVRTNGQTVNVLGTKFNVKSYESENYVRTTLLSGSIAVKTFSNKEMRLKPNQESLLNRTNHSIKVNNVDAIESIGWLNNLFSFNNADLEDIMTEIERWYDIKIDIDKWPSDRFYGQVKRNEPLSEVLKIIEESSGLRFNIMEINNERRLSLK